jgi:hypothetical protein
VVAAPRRIRIQVKRAYDSKKLSCLSILDAAKRPTGEDNNFTTANGNHL